MAANTTRKAFSVKADENSQHAKPLVLEVDWTGMSLEATRELAMKDIVIRVQGPLRKDLKDIDAGEVIPVKAVDYTSRGLDPISMLKAMSKADREKFLKDNGLIYPPD